MIKLFAVLLFFSISMKSFSQDNPNYDKHLADSLGADDYGMKSYVLVILKTGEGKIDDKKKKDSIFYGHFLNIKKLADSGKLVVSGPLFKNEKNYEGIFILNVPTIDEAKILLETDPAVKAKLLDTELYKWYGSAALPLYLKDYEKLAKKQF